MVGTLRTSSSDLGREIDSARRRLGELRAQAREGAVAPEQLDTALASLEHLLDRLSGERRSQAAAIERLNAFVSRVSQEFRTSLLSIQGYAELLATGGVGEMNETQSRFVKTIVASTAQLSGLLDGLLELDRIDAGRVRPAQAPLRLHELAQEAREMVAELAGERGHQLVTEMPSDLPLVLADHDLALKALVELLTNACKYTPQPGTITVNARPLGRQVRIGVRDTGVGIAPQDMRYIGQRFYRANQRHRETADERGSGLGLSIAFALVELMGGMTDVASEPGQGAEFAFTLPVAG